MSSKFKDSFPLKILPYEEKCAGKLKARYELLERLCSH